MNNIKKLIFVLVILIIIVLCALLYILKNVNEETANNTFDGDTEDGGEILLEEDEDGFVDVKDNGIFFSVFDSVKRYIDILQYDILELDENQNDKNGNHVQIDENKLYLLNIKNDNDRYKAIYNLLDEDYVDSNKITINNIQEYVNDVNKYTECIPISMKVKYGNNINTYLVEAYLKSDRVIQKKFIVKVNNENGTFSLEFGDNSKGIEETEKEIKPNEFNSFELQDMTDEKVILKYLEHFKKLTLEYPQIIYENYFDEEYREKRFGNYENYQKYILDNMEELRYVQITKYLAEIGEDNNTYYVGIDQYENVYVFTASAPLQYKLKLDNYTIPTDTFKKEYENSQAENKVKMNVDKFIQMINRHDYISSYACLADSFKENNFSTQDEFEIYIKNNLFRYNKFEFENVEDKDNNIYACTMKITDLQDQNANAKVMNIIMKLNGDMNFEMSFSFE